MRRLLAALTIAALSIGFVGLLSTPSQAVVPLPPGVRAQLNVQYGEADGQALLMDAYTLDAPGKHPALVYVHGGAFVEGTKQWMRQEAVYYAAQGYVGFSIDYRLAPTYTYPAPVDDAKTAIRFIREHAAEYGVDPARIGMLGSSAGGTIVATIGAEGRGSKGTKVAAVASWSGLLAFFDIYSADPTRSLSVPNDYIFGDSTADLQGSDDGDPAVADMQEIRAADPALKINSSSAPILIANSEDERVPLSWPQIMVGYLDQNDVPYQFETTPGNRHGTQLFGSMKEVTLEFFDQNVKNFSGKVVTPPPTTAPPTTGPPQTTPAPVAKPRASQNPSNAGLVALVVILGLLLIVGMLLGPVLRARRGSRLGY